MLAYRLTHRLACALNSITRMSGRAIAWLTVPMVLVATGIVVARSFGVGSIAAQETVVYLHALVLTLASAYTLQVDGHVRVDIFYRRFNPVRRAWVNSLGAVFFLLPVALFIISVSFPYVVSAWAIRESSADAGGLAAVFLLKTLILINGVLLLLQAVASLLTDLCQLTWREHPHG